MPHAPGAIICSNDLTAVGFLQAANRLGRKVPDELSLIGFDDLFLCEIVNPALTTLHLSRQEIATRVFYSLWTNDAPSADAKTSVVLPRLAIRASTGPLTKKAAARQLS
jgi:LacI family transcriptional regulator